MLVSDTIHTRYFSLFNIAEFKVINTFIGRKLIFVGHFDALKFHDSIHRVYAGRHGPGGQFFEWVKYKEMAGEFQSRTPVRRVPYHLAHVR